ncbi:MAG: tetratricopeptide repeat protein, partial [Elusimicrobiota bacterium]
PEPLFHLGKVYWERGDLARARVRFSKAAELSPSDPDIQVFLGLIEERAGRPRDAVPHYEKALALRPGDAAAKYAYARLLIKLERTRGAELLLAEFLRLWPKDPAAPLARAALGR